jgi:alpha-methylacyl-CoA racemase
VLDLSRLLPGPYCSLLLSDLGADVVKVEDPAPGDYLRALSPQMFAALNRGKRSIVLELPAKAAILRELASRADVLVESFRPGVLERLLPEPWPARLVVVRISGFGQAPSPWRERAGHDIGYIALAGILARNGALPGVQLADLFAGAQQAVIAALAALHERHRTGRGRVCDVPMTQGVTGLALAAPEPNFLDGSRPCYRAYACKGGGVLALGALEPKFWQRFCAAVGQPSWVDRGFDSSLVPLVDELFAQRTRDEWASALRDADCCSEPALTLDELRAHPLFSEAFVEGALRTYPALVPSADLPRSPAPSLGEHTDAVLREWAPG